MVEHSVCNRVVVGSNPTAGQCIKHASCVRAMGVDSICAGASVIGYIIVMGAGPSCNR